MKPTFSQSLLYSNCQPLKGWPQLLADSLPHLAFTFVRQCRGLIKGSGFCRTLSWKKLELTVSLFCRDSRRCRMNFCGKWLGQTYLVSETVSSEVRHWCRIRVPTLCAYHHISAVVWGTSQQGFDGIYFTPLLVHAFSLPVTTKMWGITRCIPRSHSEMESNISSGRCQDLDALGCSILWRVFTGLCYFTYARD